MLVFRCALDYLGANPAYQSGRTYQFTLHLVVASLHQYFAFLLEKSKTRLFCFLLASIFIDESKRMGISIRLTSTWDQLVILGLIEFPVSLCRG